MGRVLAGGSPVSQSMWMRVSGGDWRHLHVTAFPLVGEKGQLFGAVSIFWETMFRAHPRAVRWLKFDPEGTPFRYSGGKDALRFIADVSNPEWLEYQKKRVGGIIDAGLDGIFFDNTGCPGWNTRDALEGHFAALRRYIHEEKKCNILLFTNYGLRMEGITLNENMEFVFSCAPHALRARRASGVEGAHQRILDFS